MPSRIDSGRFMPVCHHFKHSVDCVGCDIACLEEHALIVKTS